MIKVRKVAIPVVITAFALLGLGYLGYIWISRTTSGLIIAGERIVCSETLVNNLSSEDRDLVMTCLSILEKRKDPIGKDKARELLKSDDDYIWFNAAQYLGSINDVEVVPYLIKGLKHPAWRAHDDVVVYLESITGEKHGKDQQKWLNWWKQEQPESTFDFSYPQIEREALELSEGSQILINGVVDPVTIRHMGPEIRLIGITLKSDVDEEQAVAFLKTLVLGQLVELEFDHGPKLDEKGARRAFVYWIRQSPGNKMFIRLIREGLSPIPFKKKTLINAYLWKSGLYDIDVDSVHDDIMKNKLTKSVDDIDQ